MMKTDQEHRVLALLVAAGLLLAAGPVRAERPPLPGIGAGDPREVVQAADAPWSSLVRVQTNVGGRCTGVLVAPGKVATAAHCLLNRAHRLLPESSLHVLFGYERGEFRSHRTVAAVASDPAYDPARPGQAIGRDWAVLTLAGPEPAGVPPVPLAEGEPAQGEPAMLGGYSQDRAQILTADRSCRIVGTAPTAGGPLLVHDCASTRGTSGTALFVRTGAGWAVAGIGVAASQEAERRNLAVPASSLRRAVGVAAGAIAPSRQP